LHYQFSKPQSRPCMQSIHRNGESLSGEILFAGGPHRHGDRRDSGHRSGNGRCPSGSWSRYSSYPGKRILSWLSSREPRLYLRILTEHQRDDSQQATKQAIEALGRKAWIYTCDLASQEQVSSLTAKVLKDGHDISILVTCAGIQRRHPSHIFPQSDWDEVRYTSFPSPHNVSLTKIRYCK
jgi:hypothetical protein